VSISQTGSDPSNNNTTVSVSGLASSISTLVSGLNHIKDEVKRARAGSILSTQDRFVDVMEVMSISANNSLSNRDVVSHFSSKSTSPLMQYLNSEPLSRQILRIYLSTMAKALTRLTRQSLKTSLP
jgi:hypothetical protein